MSHIQHPESANATPQQLASPHILGLHVYVPGVQPEGDGWIKLNTNESPYPPSPRVAEAITRECDRLQLYPNPVSRELRETIARRFGLDPACAIVGNGSDDILNLIMRCFCGHGRKAAMVDPNYSLYPVLAAIQDSDIDAIPFGPDMQLPADAIVGSDATVMFISSPNAPTGAGFTTEQFRQILQRYRGILVVDEAYADFADENATGLLQEFPQLVITRTFSKSYALAGLRVGYALSSPEVIDLLDRVRDSYNVNRLSQAGALAAFNDSDYLQDCVRRVRQTREQTRAALEEADWFVYPSQSNFLFARPVNHSGEHGPAVAASLFNHLQENRILVRYFPRNPITAPFLRISIGTDAQMARFLNTVSQWQTTPNAKQA